MLENHLDSISWISLTPQEPDYLFIPQDEEFKKQYDKGISVKDMFMLSSVGVVGGRDSLVMSKNDSTESLHKLKEDIQLFMDLDIEEARKKFALGSDSRDWKICYAKKELQETKNDPKNYTQILYRPFDVRWTYYTGKSKGFHCMPRGEVMEHFIDKENLGLICYRCCGVNGLDNIFISNQIIDLHLVGSGSQIFPLYLYPTERSKTKTLFDEGIEERVENFAPDFREKIDSLYQEHFSPEVILGYLYAVLFHKRYREQYVDFLKIDFPKIPLIEDKSTFLLLSDLGQRLIALHLLKSDELDSCVGEPLYESDKNLTIEQSKYVGERIIINSSLYFDKVSPKVWDYKIGGYQVLDKYLKSHKGEQIDYHHFQKVIQTLSASLEVEEQIAKIDIGI